MLDSAPVIAMLCVSDRPRAKQFYTEVLGLAVELEDPFAVQLNAGGTSLRLTGVGLFTPSEHPALGWRVPDIRGTAKQLHDSGVPLLRYDFLPQDEDGIWTGDEGVKVAWFKDPDGNILTLIQLAA